MNFNRYSHRRVGIIPRMNTNEKSPSLRMYCVLKQAWYPPLDSLGILRSDPRDWNPRLKVSFPVGFAEHIQDNLTRDEKEQKNNEKKKRKLERVQFLCLLVWFCFFIPWRKMNVASFAWLGRSSSDLAIWEIVHFCDHLATTQCLHFPFFSFCFLFFFLNDWKCNEQCSYSN